MPGWNPAYCRIKKQKIVIHRRQSGRSSGYWFPAARTLIRHRLDDVKLCLVARPDKAFRRTLGGLFIVPSIMRRDRSGHPAPDGSRWWHGMADRHDGSVILLARVMWLARSFVNRTSGDFMKLLLVLTSHDRLGDTGQKTGFWLEEFTIFYPAGCRGQRHAGITAGRAAAAGSEERYTGCADRQHAAFQGRPRRPKGSRQHRETVNRFAR